jgi:hypothetical protein
LTTDRADTHDAEYHHAESDHHPVTEQLLAAPPVNQQEGSAARRAFDARIAEVPGCVAKQMGDVRSVTP